MKERACPVGVTEAGAHGWGGRGLSGEGSGCKFTHSGQRSFALQITGFISWLLLLFMISNISLNFPVTQFPFHENKG